MQNVQNNLSREWPERCILGVRLTTSSLQGTLMGGRLHNSMFHILAFHTFVEQHLLERSELRAKREFTKVW